VCASVDPTHKLRQGRGRWWERAKRREGGGVQGRRGDGTVTRGIPVPGPFIARYIYVSYLKRFSKPYGAVRFFVLFLRKNDIQSG
jgi:hypothetical protein